MKLAQFIRLSSVAIGLSLASGAAIANCDFVVINYTDATLSVKAGFYGHNESSEVVKPASTRIMRVKSDYACNDSTAYGTGRIFLTFPKDPSGGGVNYSPINDDVIFLGSFSGDAGGRLIQSDNGSPVWLNAAGHAVTATTVEVKLNFRGQANSRLSGTP